MRTALMKPEAIEKALRLILEAYTGATFEKLAYVHDHADTFAVQVDGGDYGTDFAVNLEQWRAGLDLDVVLFEDVYEARFTHWPPRKNAANK